MTKLCDFENCRERATYGTNNIPIRCIKHKENMKASCGLCVCGKCAIYNFENLKPSYCLNCKKDGMINVKDKKCFCGKGLKIYNYSGNKALYCSDCKKDNMINVIHSKCFCGKAFPNYNYENLTAKYCLECKLEGMINVKEQKCFCKKRRPCFNYEGSTPAYCSECKLEGMINVNNKKCICGSTYIQYNYEGLTPSFCKNCKKDDMIDLSKKCFCGKSIPYFNYEGLTPEYCSVCKLDGMINLRSKKCLGCDLCPSFNYKDEKIPIYCSKCKKDDMVNISNPKCKQEHCDTYGNKSYKGYCTTCFQHLFPLDPLTFQIRSKTKEIAVRDFINSKFEGFQHDKPLWYNESACDCTTKRRIDHRKLINNTLLCIETDENQHKSYSKQDEEVRYHDLFMGYGGKFIFIRFNPDKYTDEKGKSCNPMLFNRLIVLEEEINKQIKRIENEENTELLEVIELYYDKK
jgi:hypothetical protein